MIIFGVILLKLGPNRSQSPHNSLCHICHTVFLCDVETTTESSESVRVMATLDFERGGESIVNFGFSLHCTMLVMGFAATAKGPMHNRKPQIFHNTSLIAGEKNDENYCLLFAWTLQLCIHLWTVVGCCHLPFCVVSSFGVLSLLQPTRNDFLTIQGLVQ